MTPVFVITFGDVFSLIALAVFLLVVGFVYAKQAWKQSRCKHDGGVSETMACDAICKQCGKNLGFIGKWREATHGIKETA
jgi:hypothetical protein